MMRDQQHGTIVAHSTSSGQNRGMLTATVSWYRLSTSVLEVHEIGFRVRGSGFGVQCGLRSWRAGRRVRSDRVPVNLMRVTGLRESNRDASCARCVVNFVRPSAQIVDRCVTLGVM